MNYTYVIPSEEDLNFKRVRFAPLKIFTAGVRDALKTCTIDRVLKDP